MKKLLILSLAILCFYACKTTSSDTSSTRDLKTYETYLMTSGTSGLYGHLMTSFCQNNLQNINKRFDELHAFYIDEINTNKKIVINNMTGSDNALINEILKSKFEGYTVSGDNSNVFKQTTTQPSNKTTYQKIFVSSENPNIIIFEEYPGKNDIKSSMQAVENNESQLLNRVVLDKETGNIEINLALGRIQTLSKEKACSIYKKISNIKYENFKTSGHNTVEKLEIELTQKSGKTQKEETRMTSVPVGHLHSTYAGSSLSQDLWWGWTDRQDDPDRNKYKYLSRLPFKSITTTTGCQTYKDTIAIPVILSGTNHTEIKQELPCKKTQEVSNIHLLKSIFVLHNDTTSDGNFIWR